MLPHKNLTEAIFISLHIVFYIMLPSITRTPDNSNCFLFPLKVRVIGIRLLLEPFKQSLPVKTLVGSTLPPPPPRAVCDCFKNTGDNTKTNFNCNQLYPCCFSVFIFGKGLKLYQAKNTPEGRPESCYAYFSCKNFYYCYQ